MNINGVRICINCMSNLYDSERCDYCGYVQSDYKQIPCCLRPGTILADRYVLGKVLGEGSFGITYIGWDTVMESRVAIKEYFPLEIATRDVISNNNNVYLFSIDTRDEYNRVLDKFLNEAKCLSKFNHLSGVVSVKDFFYANQTAYIVMDYVSGLSIKDYIKQYGRINGTQAIVLIKPVMEALIEIHKTGIVHRDISPDNLLMTEKGELVLIDFGASRVREISTTTEMTVIFKRGFSPEEQYRSRGVVGAWSDIYSLCATLYYMVTGIIPIESVERIVDDKLVSLEYMEDVDISSKQKKAIMKGMAIDAKDRFQNVSHLHAELFAQSYGNTKKQKAKNEKSKLMYILIASISVFLLAVSIIVAGLVGTIKSGEQKNYEIEEKERADDESGKTETIKPTEKPIGKPTEKPTAEPTKKPEPTSEPASKKTPAPTKKPIPVKTTEPMPTINPDKINPYNNSDKTDNRKKDDDAIGEITDEEDDSIGVIE